jgi:hypothetical protein
MYLIILLLPFAGTIYSSDFWLAVSRLVKTFRVWDRTMIKSIDCLRRISCSADSEQCLYCWNGLCAQVSQLARPRVASEILVAYAIIQHVHFLLITWQEAVAALNSLRVARRYAKFLTVSTVGPDIPCTRSSTFRSMDPGGYTAIPIGLLEKVVLGILQTVAWCSTTTTHETENALQQDPRKRS